MNLEPQNTNAKPVQSSKVDPETFVSPSPVLSLEETVIEEPQAQAAASAATTAPQEEVTIVEARKYVETVEGFIKWRDEESPSKRKQAQYLVSRGLTVKQAADVIGCRYQMVYQATVEIRALIPKAGICSVCGRPLSDPEHIKNKIGPVCSLKQSMAGKHFKRP